MPKIIENLESRLIEEAKKQIQISGYGALTIRSVAAACGVGVGTVYNYFPSKESLIATYLLEDWHRCMSIIGDTSGKSQTVQPVIRCIFDQLKVYAARHQAIFRDEAAASAFAGSFSRYHSLLRSQLAQPLRKFCEDDFTAEFVAEALLTWTMAGTDFDTLYGMIGKVF